MYVIKFSLCEGLFGSTQAAPVGFLSEHWQRWHHASPCCRLQEGGAGFQIIWYTELFSSHICRKYCLDRIPWNCPLKSSIRGPLLLWTQTFSLCCVQPWQQSSIPLDRYQIEELIQRLDRDRTGMVDYRWACVLLLACTQECVVWKHRVILSCAQVYCKHNIKSTCFIIVSVMTWFNQLSSS